MFQLKLKNVREKNILIIGDTGAGKSETLEAFRSIASNEIEDIQIISDDMGSLSINAHDEIIGYGTEIGAFVRLDDLQPGYAFGQMDRAIIINANQVNARVVIPVTDYNTIMQGHKVDYVLYANNYESVDSNGTAIRQIKTYSDALRIFRDGKVMSKGTTSSTGMVESYFANIFGPSQYPDLHEALAEQFFKRMEENGMFIGEILTQLGVTGMERNGPAIAAKNLLKIIRLG